MLKFSVKASQIANLTDARYFAAREVAWLGFNLDPGTENAVSPQLVSAIKEWVEGPKIVGEFGMQSPEEIKSAIEYLQLDAVQLGMFAELNAIAAIIDVPILKEIVIDNESPGGITDLIQAQASLVHCFIIDFAKNNISWSDLAPETQEELKGLISNHQILFNLSDSTEEIARFLEQFQPYGLILLGGDEEKVGYKSYDELDEILDLLEVEE